MDDPWEINIEDDQTMMQVPFKVSVTCQLNVIMDYLPQKGGRFFSLAKKYGPDATPAQGSNNWLSDMKDNVTLDDKKSLYQLRKEENQKRKDSVDKEKRKSKK